MRLRRPKKLPEEIEHKFTAYEGGDSHDYVMVIKGQVAAVRAVAQEMLEAGKILGYRVEVADETVLVFPESTFRHKEPLAVFEPIRLAAWKLIDPRGRH